MIPVKQLCVRPINLMTSIESFLRVCTNLLEKRFLCESNEREHKLIAIQIIIFMLQPTLNMSSKQKIVDKDCTSKC